MPDVRLTNPVRRGKKGHPQPIQIACARVCDWVSGKRGLTALDKLNSSGRAKRLERREAIAAVVSVLLAKAFDLGTQRCAEKTTDGFTICPTAKTIRNWINRDKRWDDSNKITLVEVFNALIDLEESGYITRSKQYRRRDRQGEFVAAPKMITFTKRFFLEIGGASDWLWRRVRGQARGRLQFKARREPSNDVIQLFKATEIISRYQYKSRVALGFDGYSNTQPPDPPADPPPELELETLGSAFA